MLSVVLISLCDVKHSTPAGLYLASLAEAMVQSGIRVHVISKANAQAKPSIEIHGAYSIERVSIRRGSPNSSFIVSAIARVHDLIHEGNCDAVECIDLPDCIVGLRISLCQVPSPPVLVGVLTDPGRIASYEVERLVYASDHVVSTCDCGGAMEIHSPPTPSVWSLPAMDGHVLIISDTDSQRRETVIEDYRRSGISDQGWALIALEPDGSWSKFPARAQVPNEKTPRSVLLDTAQSGTDIVRHAIKFGLLSVPEFVPEQLQSIAELSENEYQEAVNLQQISMRPFQDSDTVVQKHLDLWSQLPGQDSSECMGMWKSILKSMTREEIDSKNEQGNMKSSNPSQSVIHITIEHQDGVKHIELDTITQSSWAQFLGNGHLPADSALDQLTQAFDGINARKIKVSGCPSSCLLPLLWMRTIWLANTGVQILLHWNQVEDPSAQAKRQAAGVLACDLSDLIECSDHEKATRFWGVDIDQHNERQSGFSPRSFDALTNMFDLWDTAKEHMASAGDWTDTIRRAMLNCAKMGYQRVAIYGAGTHTQTVGEAFMNPPVDLVCIIDDDARRFGDQLWGYEIMSREQALSMKLDAVILSANSIEDTLWEQSDLFRQSGIPVIRLYGQQANDTVHALECER